MDPQHELLQIACGAEGLDELRTAALSVLRNALEADVGVFVTDLPGDGVAATLVGFEPTTRVTLEERFDTYAPDIRTIKVTARRAGVSTDVRTLGAELYRRRLYREVMAPQGGTESLFLVPEFAGRPIGFLMVGRCGGRFDDADLALARRLSPSLAVTCVAMTARPAGEPCPDGLSPAEGELLRYLELGYTTREIAAARGTSFFTVRNQLSSLYRKLDVTNRTEAVGLRRRARGTVVG